ncbi:TIGR03759 family integrating conjugative element protein [Pseudomonas chlororaphis]|uniref:TIGR03759 family integrating conjugative element protein n=1 Tax=Pseudomonas chlororaphis TaxID=587753 RepID=UPI00046F6823|nr:TIGR03759 family integrating conjugative element protein [Pseudomonas chlororaphis]
MKPVFVGIILAIAPFAAWAQSPNTQPSAIQPARTSQSQMEPSREQRLANDWGLRTEEWARYREIMDGPLGIYSPNLDPLTALGIEARSDAERRRYAELQVQAESRRVEKLLIYQRAYDDAWQRLQPGAQRVNLPDIATDASKPAAGSTMGGSGRTAVFVRDNCPPCEQVVRKLQSSGASFDVYMVGSRSDDARIRAWAQRAGVEPVKVRDRAITLNHDGGRWMALGVAGELPAVVRQIDGQWQRLP